MKIEDKLDLIYKKVGLPAMVLSVPRFIKDRNVNQLIDELKENGVEIDSFNSEQEITYKMNNIERRAFVPFKATFEHHVDVAGYILRNKQLELVLREHSKTESVSPGMIGSDVYIEYGIICSITFNGDYEEGKIVETVKGVINRFYIPYSKFLEK